MHVFVCVCMYMCACVSVVCMCVCCVHVCVFLLLLCTHIYIHTYIHTYIYTYIHTYIHTHTHNYRAKYSCFVKFTESDVEQCVLCSQYEKDWRKYVNNEGHKTYNRSYNRWLNVYLYKPPGWYNIIYVYEYMSI